MALDSTLAEAHTALGGVLEREWNWDGAERAYARAIALNPSYAHAHLRYGNALARYQGRREDGVVGLSDRASHELHVANCALVRWAEQPPPRFPGAAPRCSCGSVAVIEYESGLIACWSCDITRRQPRITRL